MKIENSKTSKAYWNTLWTNEYGLPPRFTHKGVSLSSAYRRGLHEFFLGVFTKIDVKNPGLLEVGCARSQFLPYLAIEHGAQVSGLDYSQHGCEVSRLMLARDGVSGVVECADLFDPPSSVLETADIVTSFGVIEHFPDTQGAVAAVQRLAKRRGYVLTMIPNMRAVPGALQKLYDSDVFDIHVPLSLKELRDAHVGSGMEIIDSGYVLPIHLGVCNLGRHSKGVNWRKLIFYPLMITSTLLQWFGRVVRLPKGEWLSPYLYVLARKA